MSGPRILIVNDDGVDAPGIGVMREIAGAISDDVWVIAPAGNQSGASHRFSFGREMSLEQRERRVFAIEHASPADCVVVGMTHVLGDRPADIVLSGVNNGQNLGDIMHCSGTAAGAREGALQGAIGIALSQGVDYERGLSVDWANARRFGAVVVQALVGAADGADIWFNVNFPFCESEAVSDVRVVPHQRFARSPFRHFASQNAGKFFVALPNVPGPLDIGSDFHLMNHANAITVTPVALQITDDAFVARVGGRLALD